MVQLSSSTTRFVSGWIAADSLLLRAFLEVEACCRSLLSALRSSATSPSLTLFGTHLNKALIADGCFNLFLMKYENKVNFKVAPYL